LETNKRQSWYDGASVSSRGGSVKSCHSDDIEVQVEEVDTYESDSVSSVGDIAMAFEEIVKREMEIAPISLETNKRQSWYDNASLSSRGGSVNT